MAPPADCNTLRSLDAHAPLRTDGSSDREAKLEAIAPDQQIKIPDHYRDTTQGSATAVSPMICSDELEIDILQDLFIEWDAENDDRVLSTSSSANSFVSTRCENLMVSKPLDMVAAPPAVRQPAALTKNSSSSPESGKPRFTSSSARQKHEMQMLTKEAQRLSEKLRRLQEAAHVSWLKREDDALSTSFKRLATPVWKTVAQKQRERLQQAQSKNQQLKLRALDNKKLAKDLRRALYKRTTRNAHLAKTLLFPPLHRLEADVSPEDRAVLQEMIATVNVMHVNVDNVYWTLATQVPTSMLSSGGSFRKWDVHFDTSMSIFVGVIACEEVPFRKDQVENAMALDLGGSSDMVVSHSCFRHAGPIETGIYRSRYAGRFFIDGERSVSASISIIDSVDALGQSAPGLTLKAQTWTVLTERHQSTSEHENVTTLIQTYTTITPVEFREPCAYHWDKELVEKYIVPEWDHGMCARHRRLENALLDQGQ